MTSASHALLQSAARPRAGVPRGDASGTRRSYEHQQSSGVRARPHCGAECDPSERAEGYPERDGSRASRSQHHARVLTPGACAFRLAPMMMPTHRSIQPTAPPQPPRLAAAETPPPPRSNLGPDLPSLIPSAPYLTLEIPPLALTAAVRQRRGGAAGPGRGDPRSEAPESRSWAAA